MRTIYRLNGKMINAGELVEINGEFFNPKLAEDRALAGIEAAQVAEFPDLRLFDCTEDEAGNLTITPKDPIIIAYHEQVNLNAASQRYLDSTDWYVTRFAETGVVIPADVKLERQAARDAIIKQERSL